MNAAPFGICRSRSSMYYTYYYYMIFMYTERDKSRGGPFLTGFFLLLFCSNNIIYLLRLVSGVGMILYSDFIGECGLVPYFFYYCYNIVLLLRCVSTSIDVVSGHDEKFLIQSG